MWDLILKLKVNIQILNTILPYTPAFITNKNHSCFHIVLLLLEVYKHIMCTLPHFEIKVVSRLTVGSFLFNVLIKSTYINYHITDLGFFLNLDNCISIQFPLYILCYAFKNIILRRSLQVSPNS